MNLYLPVRRIASPLLLSHRRLVSTAAVKKYESFLKGVSDPESREIVGRVLEQAEKAAERWSTTASDFMYPNVQQECLQALKQMSAVASGFAFGGYEGAERCRWMRDPCSPPLSCSHSTPPYDLTGWWSDIRTSLKHCRAHHQSPGPSWPSRCDAAEIVPPPYPPTQVPVTEATRGPKTHSIHNR